MKEYFQTLKKKRIAKKRTLEDIHQKTRLPIHYLKAIEEGEIEKLPRGYERIYLRRFAHELGMDVDEVLKDFDVLTGRLTREGGEAVGANDASAQEEEADKEPAESFLPEAKQKRFRSRMDSWNMEKIQKYFWIGLGGVILAITGYLTVQQYLATRNSKVNIKEVPVSDIARELTKADSSVAQKKPGQKELAAGLKIELKAREKTWVKEIKDSRDTTDYILPAGTVRNIAAREQVRFMFGRADGVEVWLNGQNLGTMGRGDQVVTRLVINRQGIVEKRMHSSIVPRPPSAPDSAAAPSDSSKVSMRQIGGMSPVS